MRNTFKNFLGERSEYQPPNDGGDFDGGDENDGHIDEWAKHFGDAMGQIPFVHNTNEGTHKWENLANAMKAHASEAAHSTIYLAAPDELGEIADHLHTLGASLGGANIAMQQKLMPHVVRAVKVAQQKLSDNNPFKAFNSEELAQKEFEKHHDAAVLDLALRTRQMNATVPEYAMDVIPHIVSTLQRHGPHGFMLKGGHFGMMDREDEAHPRFFPKWGPPGNN